MFTWASADIPIDVMSKEIKSRGSNDEVKQDFYACETNAQNKGHCLHASTTSLYKLRNLS